ncbi:hypothetical protein CIW49_24280 [Mycolicibacterium sp. P1-18]|uniref:hypothetical protein n=1 Tax=Mycolicibacterium sp. P1-18 TaxID=2024615 RepID=UPI0011F0D048|nr:hypothetical protein [Mycolicibacterium sp. P1-18]KAA0094676.1 hypothetical protein CIW49_24280 [Mycolicibacterium sp. P1-18]
MKKTKKFGLATLVASGFAAGILGVAAPMQATASAETLPVLEMPGYSAGVDHHDRRVKSVLPAVNIAHADNTVQQSR